MPITALPQHTVRAIGSTSVISDPCSIVKELLDNALDASASSVFVEISHNTLDVIQVKDNGHGIPSEDHAVVCNRTFTSKIQTVEDLRNIGGSSLGFRGEALASVAEMSGGLTVTTRVAAEVVGSSIKYGRNGEVISSQRASHPVGTTVRITDFLKHIPVRRQTALKSAGKTSKIKKLLQAYAVCQPTKRLSLKVMKAKNESNNWMYAGSKSASFTDAALKIVGTDVVSNCTTKEWPPEDDSAGYKIVALLAKDDADFTKVINAGQYFGVDGRPLASGRGIARDITKLYRNYLSLPSSGSKESASTNDPFLCLQIQCPPGSYDVNIEPAKDDVLFEDPQRVLSMAEDLFRDMYGDIAGSAEKKKPSNKGKEKMPYNDGFELLMAQKSPVPPASQLQKTGDDPGPSSIIPSSAFRRSSLPSSSRSLDVGSRSEGLDSQDGGRRSSGGREALNPWSMTRLNAPFRTSMRTQAGPSTVPVITSTTRRESARRYRGENQMSPTSSRGSILPSPPPSNSNPNSTSTSPMDARPSPVGQNIQTSPTSIQCSTRRARERDRERYNNGALDTWFSRITQLGLRESEDQQPESEEEEPSLTQLAQARLGSPEKSPSNTPETLEDLFIQDDIDNTQATPESSQLTQGQGPSRGPSQAAEIAHKRQEFPVMEKWSARLHQLSGSQSNSELEQALDFERRKKEANLKRREEMRSRLETPPYTNSPHHSRYLAARASLSSRPNEQQSQLPSTPESCISKSMLGPFDPRAYLIRQNALPQEPPKDGKARRIQTAKLPLEKIPDGNDLHDICLIMPLDISELTSSIETHLTHDLYTQCGDDFNAFTESDSDGSFNLWKYRLCDLINKNYETKESGAPCLDFDFSNIRHLPESE